MKIVHSIISDRERQIKRIAELFIENDRKRRQKKLQKKQPPKKSA